MLWEAEKIGNFTRTEEPQPIRCDSQLEIFRIHLTMLQCMQTHMGGMKSIGNKM